jgi:hypothetical protein
MLSEAEAIAEEKDIAAAKANSWLEPQSLDEAEAMLYQALANFLRDCGTHQRIDTVPRLNKQTMKDAVSCEYLSVVHFKPTC